MSVCHFHYEVSLCYFCQCVTFLAICRSAVCVCVAILVNSAGCHFCQCVIILMKCQSHCLCQRVVRHCSTCDLCHYINVVTCVIAVAWHISTDMHYNYVMSVLVCKVERLFVRESEFFSRQNAYSTLPSGVQSCVCLYQSIGGIHCSELS